AAQSRFRLRDTFRRLRMRDQPRSARTENRRSRKETARSGFGTPQRRRIFEVPARPRAIPFPARFRIEPLSGGVYAWLSGSVERQRDSVGGRERLTQRSRSRGQKGTARGGQALVRLRLAADRTKTAHLHRRGHFGIPFSVRRQPRGKESFLPTRGML